MSEGDKFCNVCFNNRKKSASNYHEENLLKKNWGLYFIPIAGPYIAIGKGIQSTVLYPGGNIYHVYIQGRHEKWSKHNKDSSNLQKCENCNKFVCSYYQLRNYEY